MSGPLRHGDRIKVSTVDDDGLPIVRYGTVGASLPDAGPVVVEFDDMLGGDIVDRSEVVAVRVDTVELVLNGPDLVSEATLRRGLADMWRAEADLAGLDIGVVHPLGSDGAGVENGTDGWLLAEFTHIGTPHVVRTTSRIDIDDTVVVRADRMNRWDGFTA
ncbi:MAG: hypothetical protein ACO3RB_01730 [Ilumatobacteraceae bacterium]